MTRGERGLTLLDLLVVLGLLALLVYVVRLDHRAPVATAVPPAGVAS